MSQLEPPDYFEAIRRDTATRWEKREADPEESGVWHQLFRQVQSPRHVVSELLQNADDAEATEAWIGIDDDDCFVFEHNGRDFTKDQFQSLCRFGYSNKRSLFTIGFRGIGFKSTFSLGSPVFVHTPSLSICFHENRFTEPLWVSPSHSLINRTRISVKIADEHCRAEIEKNFQDWIESPLSLLFFRHIRCISFGERALRWRAEGPGPVKNSEWIVFDGSDSERYMIVRSAPEPFPSDALDEIRRERMAPGGEELVFPPCAVELVLGDSGGFYVVLPTGGETGLPFSANAPFMLTPDREHIKTPALSAVNRWLIGRIGRLAGSVMTEWLTNADLSIENRADAYEWLPADTPSYSEDQRHGDLVRKACDEALKDQAVLLCDDGQVRKSGEAIMLPNVALVAWGAEEASKFLDEASRPALSCEISARNEQKLVKRGLVEKVEDKSLPFKLAASKPPRPANMVDLVPLWRLLHAQYLAPRAASILPNKHTLNIVPIQGAAELHCAQDAIRLSTTTSKLVSDSDWHFLTRSLSVIDPTWLRCIDAIDREAIEKLPQKPSSPHDAAAKLLHELEFSQASGSNRLVDLAAAALASNTDVNSSEWIRLAHIAVALNVEVGNNFRFLSAEGKTKCPTDGVLYDIDGRLDSLLPVERAEELMIHPDYGARSDTCTPADWDSWARSAKSGLSFLPAIVPSAITSDHWKEFEGHLSNLQDTAGVYYPYTAGRRYTSQVYTLVDFDFSKQFVKFWSELPAESNVWLHIAIRLLADTTKSWSKTEKVYCTQTTTAGGGGKTIGGITAPAAWLRRLRGKPCLPDRNGLAWVPSDLMRRTPTTAGLLDVMPFVDPRLDMEANWDLLDILGVNSKPPGPETLLNCLESLTHAPSPPITEVEKWYRRLEQFTQDCSDSDLRSIAEAFSSKSLILSREGLWYPLAGIFRDADETDAPGLPLIMESVKDLRLWERIEVPARPTEDAAISWLKAMAVGKSTDKSTVNRVEAMLKRYPIRIWNEIRHWLDISGRWSAVENLDHFMDDRQRIAFSNLHEWVKQRVADFRMLPADSLNAAPFVNLKPLENSVQERLLAHPSSSTSEVELSWLEGFGSALCRLRLEDREKSRTIREVGSRMVASRLHHSPSIEVTPYFEDKPAGTSRRQEVAWIDTRIYCLRLPSARMARLLPEHLGRFLPMDHLRESLNYCYERPIEDIMAYMEANYDLVNEEEILSAETDSPDTPVQPSDEPEPKCKPTGEVPPAEAEPPEPSPEPHPDHPGAPDSDPPISGSRKPSGPGLMERFALARGFRREDDAFVHADGSRIAKDGEMGFGWRITDANYHTRYLRPIDACLKRNPVEIAHEVWAAIERSPHTHGLILLDPQDSPVELSGSDLCRMKHDGLVTLHPATYRLIHVH